MNSYQNNHKPLSICYLLFRNILALFVIVGFLLPSDIYATHTSRHVTLHCADKQLLCDFNKNLELGPRLGYLMTNQTPVTIEDEVIAKINTIIRQAEIILGMSPKDLHVNVVILPTSQDCSRIFSEKYGKLEKKLAYYSLSENTIYISAAETRLGVVAHELGHAIIDFYFSEQPPSYIHELMAQSVETHIDDNEELLATFRRMDENAAKIRNACNSYAPRKE